MAIFTNKDYDRITEIKMWDEKDIEWSNDFYNVGTLKSVYFKAYDITADVIPDINYAINSAREWEKENPEEYIVTVTELL